MYPLKDINMESVLVHFNICSIDVRMFGFKIGNADGIKHGLTERTYMDYLLVSYEISRNNKFNGLLDRIT